MYALEFSCLSIVKLMVLDRKKDFALPLVQRQPQRWTAAARVVVAGVVGGNIVGLLGNTSSVLDTNCQRCESGHCCLCLQRHERHSAVRKARHEKSSSRRQSAVCAGVHRGLLITRALCA